MASAKDGHPEIADFFRTEIDRLKPEDQPERERNWVMFAESLDEQLVAEVVDALRLTHQIVEVVVRAPLAARNFHPGEFYRLQNYETFAEEVDGIKLTMEGIALTGAWVDRERGLDLAHRAGNGRQQPAVLVAGTGREGRAHGADGHAHRDPDTTRPSSSPAAAWATPCSFPSPWR